MALPNHLRFFCALFACGVPGAPGTPSPARTRSRGRRRGSGARIATAAFVLSVLLACGGVAHAAVPPSIDAGQVQKRIPHPTEKKRALPKLRVPAPAKVTPHTKLRFVLTGVVISGATAFKPLALDPTYEADLAREIGLGDVEKILHAITAKYRDAGYFLSRAIARPQPLELGILHITVVEGYVRHVTFRDASPGEKARLSRYFAAVVGKRPLRLAPLERALLLVNDIPGLHVHPSLRPEGKESAAYDLVLTLQQRRFSGFASLDNRGTESLGPWETQISGGINSVFRDFDRLQASVFDTPNRPADLLSTELSYDTPVGSDGTRLSLSVARTHLLPGGSLAPQGINATAMRYATQITYPLLRSRDQSLWLGAGFVALDSRERDSTSPLFDDHLRILRGVASYVGKDSAQNVDTAQIDVSQGLSALGASRPGAAGLSRSGGRADFTKISGTMTRLQILSPHWAAQFAVAGQIAGEPLLLSEQFALGGVPFGRGYDPAEIAGDDAAAGSAELRYGRFVKNPLIRSYQLYGFYDFGMVWNLDAAGTAGGRQSLASLGVGLRLALIHGINLDVEVAKPLTRRVAAANGKPVRAFVELTAPF